MSTLSSVTDGQLCEDSSSTPGCPPKLVVQTSNNQAVVAVTPVRLVTENGAGATVTMRQSTQVVLGGAQAPSVVVSSQSQRVIAAGGQGVQGQDGATGASGAGLLSPIDFAYGDASPSVVLTLGADSEIVAVSLQVEEAFNGTSPSMSLGVSGDTDSLVPPEFVDLSALGTFEFSPRVEYAAGTQLLLTITPGAGASQGRGQIIISAVPT